MGAAIVCLVAAGACALAAQAPRGDRGASQLSLGKPVQVGRIAVVPIVAKYVIPAGKYITLAQATKEGLVEIVEVPGNAEVNSLEVRNRASLPLLLVTGELLLGGKQDRIVAKDTIVPPRESRQVPVFCVEHGRWESGKMSFTPADTYVPDAVRSAAFEGQSQREVWDKVAESNAKARTETSTGTVRALISDEKVQNASAQTVSRLSRAFASGDRAVGVICWLDGKILSADLFASPALFEANRSKLLRSYCADMVLADSAKTVPVDMRKCASFLSAITSSRRTLAGRRSGEQNTYGLDAPAVKGYETGGGAFGGGFGGGGFGHGTYKPGGR